MSGERRTAPDPRRVARMFDDVAARYDFVNTVLSAGMDTQWRRAAADATPTRGVEDLVLDLGCGSGKLGDMLASRARVVGLDVSGEMLRTAHRAFGREQRFVQGSAFDLPFDDDRFAGAVSAFVLRNLNDLFGAFGELRRVVRPGGTIALVDITGPQTKWLRLGFDLYFSTVAPLLGLIVGEPQAYRYLAKSLAQLPAPEELAGMLRSAGFEDVAVVPLTLGMVTLWTARVPASGVS
jgi:demethylmenaquinone methyltransferase/2-methoxy-6-polyprenyl-1,4-benzoquinol methylase